LDARDFINGDDGRLSDFHGKMTGIQLGFHRFKWDIPRGYFFMD
jgi:hypothetical protein